jgi:STE24 endopeptidase
MRDVILISLIFATTKIVASIITRTVTRFLNTSFQNAKGEVGEPLFDVKEYLRDWVFLTLIGIIVLFPLIFLEQNSAPRLWIWACIALTVPLFPAYDFFIRPVIFSVISRPQFVADEGLKTRVKNLSGRTVQVYIVNKNIKNVYATGIIPFSQMIYIGKPLYEQISQQSLNALLLHEIGHLHHRHLFKLYCVNALCCSFVLSIAFLFHQSLTIPDYPGLSVALRGGFLGLMLILIPSLVQRTMEYQADSFAASMVGVQQYREALHELDRIGNGGVSKGSLNYPTLEYRIKNIEKLSYSAV